MKGAHIDHSVPCSKSCQIKCRSVRLKLLTSWLGQLLPGIKNHINQKERACISEIALNLLIVAPSDKARPFGAPLHSIMEHDETIGRPTPTVVLYTTITDPIWRQNYDHQTNLWTLYMASLSTGMPRHASWGLWWTALVRGYNSPQNMALHWLPDKPGSLRVIFVIFITENSMHSYTSQSSPSFIHDMVLEYCFDFSMERDTCYLHNQAI